MGKKQAYYFPHFLNARNDNKVLKLRRVLGIEGYGIFFMLLEVLREQNDMRYPLSGLSELEFDFRTSKEKIGTVIHDYDLFKIDNDNFFSPRLIEYMQPYFEKSERARVAANKKWELANADANGMQMHPKNHANADAINKLINESINKDSKGENSPPPKTPTTGKREKEALLAEKQDQFLQTLQAYSNEYSKELIESFFEYWKEPNKSKTKMRFEMQDTWDLQLRLTRWEKNNYKFGKPPTQIEKSQFSHDITLLS